MAAAVDTIETRPTLAGGTISRWRNVLIEVPRAQSGEAIRAMAEAAAPWLAAPPRRLGVLVILSDEGLRARPPGGDFREAMMALRARYEQVLAAHAVVFPGAGLGAIAVRALMTGVSQAARLGFAQRIAATEHEACAWMVTTLERAGAGCGSLPELRAAVAQVVSSG